MSAMAGQVYWYTQPPKVRNTPTVAGLLSPVADLGAVGAPRVQHALLVDGDDFLPVVARRCPRHHRRANHVEHRRGQPAMTLRRG